MTFRVLGDGLPVNQVGGLEFYPKNIGPFFSPADIDGLQLWLKADAGTFQDSGKTTPAVSDGDVIGAWADQSGSGRDVLQGVTADKPTLRLNVRNGRPITRFDGTSDFLQAIYADVVQPYVRFIVLESDGGSNNQILTSASANTAVIYFETGKIKMSAGGVLVGSDEDTNWHIYAGVFNGASSSFRSDGSAILGNPGPLAIDGGTTVGSFYTGLGSFFGGDIAEVLDYYNITPTEIVEIEEYLAGKYGIALA